MADYRRLLRAPPGSFSVFGPRGAGKTTWARAALPGAHEIDLRNEGECHIWLADPARLMGHLHTVPAHVPVVVSGINRARALLHEVRRAIDATGRRFALLGSSVCSLRGDAAIIASHLPPHTLLPLVPAELGRDFSLERVLRFGSLPAIWDAADPRGALDDYVQDYVREEIRGEAAVRNLPAFLRFLPVAALAHGQVVNVSALARDADTSRSTLEGYLGILRDTLMATLLPAFEPRLRVRERRHPRLYWTDAGVVRAIKRQLGEVTAEERAPLVKGVALTVLRAHNERGEIFDDIGYWSPGQARATEVDFLLRRGREYLAIEIDARTRHTRHTRPAATGLRAITSLPHLVRRVLVSAGGHPRKTDDGIDVWPLPHWFDAVAGGGLWP